MREWPKNCINCGLFRACDNPAIDGKGDMDAEVLCLFEAPGQTEDDKNEILCGPAGQRLYQIANTFWTRTGNDIGPERGARWENVVMCYPKSEKTPKIGHVRHCRPFWIEKARKMPNLKKIICFGGIALKSVLNQEPGRIEKWRHMAILVPEFPDWTFFATYHPAYTLGHRRPQAEKWILEDLEFAFNWRSDGSRIDELPGGGTAYAEADDPALWSLSDPKNSITKVRPWWILDVARRYIVVDIEHTVPPAQGKVPPNMGPWPDSLGRVGELALVCWRTRTSSGKQRLLHSPRPHILGAYLADEHQTSIVFEAQHDLSWLWVNYGIWPKGRIYDPRVAYNLLDENYPDKSLEGICKRVFDAKPWKKAFWDSFDWQNPDWGALDEYCMTDVQWTERLAFWTAQKLVEEGLDRLMVHEMANYITMVRALCLGTAYDSEEAGYERGGLLLEAEAMHERARMLTGRETLNLNSPGQILDVLQLYNKRVRDTSTPTLRRWLWREPGNEFVRLVLEHRRLQSRLRYLTNYRRTLSADGRFHPRFGSTETGRLTCSEPNLMNVMR